MTWRWILVGGPYDGAWVATDCWPPDFVWVRRDPERRARFGLLASMVRRSGSDRYVLSRVNGTEAVYQYESVKTGLPSELEGAAA